MMSLKEQSLFSLAKEKKNFAEVISLCKSNNSIKDVCLSSKAFWLAILPLIDMEDIALCFEPLKEKYWTKLIEGLMEGIVFQKYFDLEDEFLNGENHDGLLKIQNVIDAQKEHGDIKNLLTFSIPGIKLYSGTQGWVIDFAFDFKGSDIPYFILSSKNEKDDNKRILDILALLYFKKIHSIFFYRHIVITDDENKYQPLIQNGYVTSNINEEENVWRFEKDNLPSKEFIRKVLSGNYDSINSAHWKHAMILLFSTQYNNSTILPDNQHDTLHQTYFNIYKGSIY